MVAVFRKAFRDSRRTMFWLAIGFALYGLIYVAFYPALLEQTEEFNKLLEAYPDEMIAMFYTGDIEDFDLTAPGQYLQMEFNLFCTLILGVIASVQAFNAFTNAERDGTLDVMLSLPVSRRAYLIGRVLNSVLMVMGVLVGAFLALWVGTLIWPEFEVSVWRLALGIVGEVLPVMVVGAFAYLLAVTVPSSRHFAGPLVYLFWIGSYLAYSLASAIESLQGIRPFLLFHYFNGGEVIDKGVDLADWAILVAVALVYLALAWWFVDKKELGV